MNSVPEGNNLAIKALERHSGAQVLGLDPRHKLKGRQDVPRCLVSPIIAALSLSDCYAQFNFRQSFS